MTIFWNGIGIIFCGLAAILILKETRREYIPYIIVTLGILSYLALMPVLHETYELVGKFTSDLTYGKVVLKAAGMAMLTEIGVEICKSAGEPATAGYISLLGKGEILVMTLPLYRQLVTLAIEFLS
ncbi:MAG: hypothetical protein II993_06390 [Anaerotignum sp.]|nr:hypothetical protein [Clostridia bacterium]MBQ3615603.1 hypothetical protein [Anaerotignum sp.]